MPDKPRLIITMGDVNGIGPEILAKALANKALHRMCRPVVAGSVTALASARRFAPQCPAPVAVHHFGETPDDPHVVPVVEAGYAAPTVRPGILDPEAGRCAVEWIKAAVHAVQAGDAAGLVTCPISKDCIYQAGYQYIGHTELVAEMTGSAQYRMCLFAGAMRVLHNTGHMRLREALDWVTTERVLASIRIGHDALARMGLEKPRIGVAGLNPHASEKGAFGNEEADHVIPAIEAAVDAGIQCSGPDSPDAIFRYLQAGRYDMVIALYHDQGHIPLKLIAMDEGVNVTLGIPIVRTSVDHGTAFDIAGQGIAREHSLCAAVDLAVQLAGRMTPTPAAAP